MPLTQDEIDGCRDAFLAFDKDRSGTIDVWELRQVLEAMGQSGLGHRDWVQAISREHQQTLKSEPLAPEVLADFRAMSAQSLVEQKEQEAADSQSFPEFLEAYLKS